MRSSTWWLTGLTAAFAVGWGAFCGRVTLGQTVPAAAQKGGVSSQSNTMNLNGSIVIEGKTGQQFWFGVAVENLPQNISRQLKLKPEQGLLVIGVFGKSPAERAGLKADDILLELNGTPLTSQEELAKAANTTSNNKQEAIKGLPVMPTCDLVYLRDGDRAAVKITAEQRPVNMFVSGGNLQNFRINPATTNTLANSTDMRSYVLPNGQGMQVGPGYKLDLQGGNASSSWIKEAVKDGETLVLSQETDDSGNVKNTMTAGGKKYLLPDDLAKMPPNLQAAAQQFFHNTSQSSSDAANAKLTTAHALPAASLDQQMQEQRQMIDLLRQQNELLQKQLDHMQKTLDEKLPSPQTK